MQLDSLISLVFQIQGVLYSGLSNFELSMLLNIFWYVLLQLDNTSALLGFDNIVLVRLLKINNFFEWTAEHWINKISNKIYKLPE